jgi:hypothetical protein
VIPMLLSSTCCAACTGTPSTTTPAIPQYSAWECSDTASGSKCSAKCVIGYNAQAATSWASTCTAGTWSTPAADGTDQSLVCRPNRESTWKGLDSKTQCVLALPVTVELSWYNSCSMTSSVSAAIAALNEP